MAEKDTVEAEKPKVFISYSRKDMPFADRLEPALKNCGIEPLIDRTEIYAFEDWWKRIRSLIGKADSVIFVLSPDAVSSDVCAKEVAYAASLNKRFAPIVWRRVEDKAVPEELARLNFVFFDDDARFDDSIARLAQALVTDIGWVRRHTEFGQSAQTWELAKRPGGLLLRSPLLEEGERWIASRPRGAPAPTSETQAFIVESRRATTRRRNILTSSLSAGLALSLGLAGLAYWQRGIAIENEVRAVKNEKVADEQRAFAEQRQIEAEQRRREAEEQRAIAEKKTQEAQRNLLTAGYFANDVVTKIALKLPSLAALPPEKMLEELGAIDETLIQAGTLVRAAGTVQKNAALWTQLGGVLFFLGDFYAVRDGKRAARDFEEALALRRELVAVDPGNMEWQNDASVTLYRLGDIRLSAGDVPNAIKAYEEGIDIARKVIAADLTKVDRQTNLGYYYSKLGDARSTNGNPDAALASYRAAAEIGEKLASNDPSDIRAQRNLSVYLRQLGDTFAGTQRGEAIATYRKSLELRQFLATSNPSDGAQIELAEMYERLGKVLWADEKRNDALSNLENAVTIREKITPRDPSIASLQTGIAAGFLQLGDVLLSEGNSAEAVKGYQKSLVFFQKVAERIEAKEIAESGKAGESTAIAFGSVANSALFAQSFDQALAASDRAVALGPNLLWLKANRAHALMFLGRNEEAKQLYVAFKGQNLQERSNKSWEVGIGEDFVKFRKAGLDRFAGPAMTEVEAALGLRSP
ncbi:MAG: TIR domain-containing protein [Hyphomicrobium sp.]